MKEEKKLKRLRKEMDHTLRCEIPMLVVEVIGDRNEEIPDISTPYNEIQTQQLSIQHSLEYSVSESIECPLYT